MLNFKGFRFYCPSNAPKVIEVRNLRFLKDVEFSGNIYRQVEFEENVDPIRKPINSKP